MISIALVEDDRRYTEQLKGFLCQYEAEKNLKFNIVTFSDGDEIVERYDASYDINNLSES